MSRLLTSLLAALLWGVGAMSAPAFAGAAQAASPVVAPASDAEVARWLRFRIERQKLATGGVVAIVRPTGRSLVAHGPIDRRRARRLDGDSVFEIASLSKVFTALLLADFVVRGEARLEDPLAGYVPPGVTVPAFDGAAITLVDLDRPGDDANTRMALGWRRTTIHGETYYWSHGSGDGARAFMGFNPARRVGVVAIADAASGAGLDDIARRVLDPQQDVDLKVTPRRQELAVPAAALERALGTYEFAADDRIQISRGETGLIVTAGASQLLIVPQSPTRFFSKYGGDILFEFPGSGPAPSSTLVLHQDGERFVYRRVP